MYVFTQELLTLISVVTAIFLRRVLFYGIVPPMVHSPIPPYQECVGNHRLFSGVDDVSTDCVDFVSCLYSPYLEIFKRTLLFVCLSVGLMMNVFCR